MDSGESSRRMFSVLRMSVSLLLLLSHFTAAQKPGEDAILTPHLMHFSVSPQSLASLLLLGLTVVLSGCVYLWILRYVCVGSCQPVPVGAESEALAAVV